MLNLLVHTVTVGFGVLIMEEYNQALHKVT
jgi:hypothetical protein